MEKIKTLPDYTWGNPVYIDKGKLSLSLNPQLGKGEEVCYIVEDGLFCYNTDFIYEKSDTSLDNMVLFKDNAFIFYKMLEGRFLVDIKEYRQLILKRGDIGCLRGNGIINNAYGFGERIRFFGFIFYYEAMLKTFKKLGWDDAIIEILVKPSEMQNLRFYTTDFQLDQLLTSLYTAIVAENRMLVKAKTIELLHYIALNLKKLINENQSTYATEQIKIVMKIKQFLDEHIDTYYTTPYLAKRFGIGLTRFQEIFKASYDISPYRYHLDKRLENAAMLLLESDLNIADIGYNSGFTSHSKFIEAFREKFNCLPSQYRRKTYMNE